MLQICRAHAIVHPRTMMVHPTHATVAYTTMMAHGRLKRLTLPAHAVRRALPPLFLLRHGRPRHRPRIGQRRLGMTRQRHGAYQRVNHAQNGGYALRHREERHGNGRIRHEEPDEGGHDGPRLIAAIHPNALLLPGPEGKTPRFVIVGVDVMFARRAYAGRRLLLSAVPRILVGKIVLQVFGGVYLTAAGGVEAGAQKGSTGGGGRPDFLFAVADHGFVLAENWGRWSSSVS